MSKHGGARLPVRKMYKLFVNGSFVRSESGRSDPLWDGKQFGANVARASRKDARDAVVAARAAAPAWWNTPPAMRGLMLYRLAEMMEARAGELTERVREGLDLPLSEAHAEVSASVDRTLWYAGWCDKFAALLSTRNPVSGPYFNVSSAEPNGVVAVLAPDRPSLLGLISVILPPIVAGNAIVSLASERDPRTAIVFAEALATSDLPAGVVNVLTGYRSEIAPVLAKHMDVDAIAFEDGDAEMTRAIERESAENVKRVRPYARRSHAGWFEDDAGSLSAIADFCEIKTIWHPSGM
ncbi:MAG: aldehyde dehydrogenase family protein [Candidatus Eremiobacteraeota bacterium]|nr:aldehyde dehydrogenase family protein [Candidatus Eremiobacteraeota bacterium]